MRRAAGLLLPALLCVLLTGCFDSPPQIITLVPDRGSVGVAADTPIEVQFDRAVVPDSVAGHFTVSPPIAGCDLSQAATAGLGAPCRIVWSSGDSAFTLHHPGAILAPDTQYTFTLRGGFRDPEGATNTVDHSWFITTAGAPLVRAVNPADGATDVPVDAPITIDFSSGMDPITTEAAIRLEPSVPGTRVIANSKDKSRFMLLPGEVLHHDVAYRVSIAQSATDEHEQRLALPATISFTAGGLSPGGHALVLVRRPGESATEIHITALAAVEDGLPIAAEPILTAPRCGLAAGCGAAGAGTPLFTYSECALSPDNRWLAVVEQDRTDAATPSALVVLDAASLAQRQVIPNGRFASWSPDSRTLAYAISGSVELYSVLTGRTAALPAGDPIVSPPVWGPQSELLALDEAGPSGEHIDLADALVAARYPLPGVLGNATTPVMSPDGTALAFARLGPPASGTWLTGIGNNTAQPRRLDVNLTPLGFADAGTLIALTPSTTGTSTVVRVSVSSDVQIANPPAPGAFSVPEITVSPSGRQLVYLAAPAGVPNAFIENADGSDPVALTAFLPGTFEAAGLSING